MLTLFTALGFGFVLGMRHALEPDHVAAVSALVAERPGWRRGALLGASWGIGHGVALLGLGGALFLLRARLPEPLADGLELVVAIVLIGLGVRSLRRAFRRGEGPAQPHRHGGRHHAHATNGAAHVHLGALTVSRRPLLIGLAHGLAGSGALTALVLASMPTTVAGLLYIALFGLGSVGGMALLTALAGWQLRRLAIGRAHTLLLGLAGTFSLLLGFAWGSPIVLRLWRLL